MNSLNYYDNIAHVYDQTRWLTESVAEEVADFIINLTRAAPKTNFLEPGVGTGLNVFPLVKRGYSVTGIDVSQEMLDQFSQKFNTTPPNLNLIHADASQLPFSDNSFDVVLTVHMLHTVSDWRVFLDDIHRVLKPGGFYLNSQWITPPARKEFEGYFREFLDKYKGINTKSKGVNSAIPEINTEGYLNHKGYVSNYLIAKEWTVSNTVEELLNLFKLRPYGLCWQVSEDIFHKVLKEFEEFCIKHYGSLKTILSSEAKFEIWAYSLPLTP
ncbi:SAM-dependent methyltransferase [Calothrix sp. HK-06]|nr:SAM-dependent methyltransferase [Calothrix sp. HK-06]